MKSSCYKCPDCESHSSSEGLVCPVHGKELVEVESRSPGGRFTELDGVWVQQGLKMEVPEGRIKRDNGTMTSLSMGCPDPAKQKEWLAAYSKAGVDNARFHPKTGALVYDGGRAAQRRLMKVHQFSDNN